MKNSELFPKAIKNELIELEKQLEAIYQKKTELIDKTTKECTHDLEYIRHLPSTVGWIDATSPWLICSMCGLTEEGWGSGYKILKHADNKQIPEISFDNWLAMRTKAIPQYK